MALLNSLILARKVSGESASLNGDVSSWDVPGVASMVGTCAVTSPFSDNVGPWGLSDDIDMRCVEGGGAMFNGDVHPWDVSGVGNTCGGAGGDGTIVGALSIADVGGGGGCASPWDVSGVIVLGDWAASFNGDINSWGVSSAAGVRWTGNGSVAFNGDISSWDVSGVAGVRWLGNGSVAFNGDTSSWDVPVVAGVGAAAFNGDIGLWDVPSYALHARELSFNGTISAWACYHMLSPSSSGDMFNGTGVSSVCDTSLVRVRANCDLSFNGDFGSWDVSGVTDTSYMCNDAAAFNGDIGLWDVSSCALVNGDVSFYGDFDSWDVSGVTDTSYMCNGAAVFYGVIGLWDVSSCALYARESSFNGAISEWAFNSGDMFYDTGASYVRNASLMHVRVNGDVSFYGDFGSWADSAITDTSYMCNSAAAFSDIGVWAVSAVTDTTEGRAFPLYYYFDSPVRGGIT
jgi:hypothetical protein